MIKVENLSMLFSTEEVQTKALDEVTFEIKKGEFVAIMGPSGCGKSTLLNILGTLDNSTSGSYFFEGKQVDKMNENQLTALRKGNIGFIFQSFNLIDELTVYENVELPLIYLNIKSAERKQRVREVLEKVNMLHRANHLPQQLSGGQQQRVAIERAFPQMAEKYKTEEALKNKTWGVRLEPLEEIHLDPQLGYEAELKGNRSAIIALIFGAIAILVIAWINYINLTVARSMERAKEVGVRRVVGAFPKQLVGQFLFEALVMNLIALIIAIGLIELLLPAFNQLVGRTVTFSVWFTEYWGLLVLLLFAAGIYISGYYPAWALLRKKPIVLLKGKFQNSRAGESTRKVLVIVQYTASMILLCGTLVVFAQLSYMRRQSLGVKTDQMLVIKSPAPTEDMKIKMEAMRKALKRLPLVSKVTCSGSVPGEEVAMFLSNRRAHDALKQNRLYEMLGCDPDYIEAYGLKVVAGRGFSEEYGDDINKLVINETAVRMLGYVNNEDAIGEEISVETIGEPMQVIGVVKDYHQQALNKSYTPIMLFHKDKIDWIPQRYISVVMQTDDPSALVAQIAGVWNSYFADSSFDYFFLDQFYDSQYRQDEAFGVLMGGFTGLAIFVSCLGLWVLVMFSCAVRTKEMGIRKVLGASKWNLFYQLGKGFFIPVMIAVVVALPISWFCMNAWLSHYAFRTDLKVWFFMLPVVLMLFISFLTVAGQTMKVIYSKPARSLRYE